jgi:hypothetical protein
MYQKLGYLMPLFPKYITPLLKQYQKLNTNRSKQFNFTTIKDEKKGFFGKKNHNKHIIY